MRSGAGMARGVVARALMLAAAVSIPLTALKAQTSGKYPIKLANGFEVDRGGDVLREYCLLRGFRAQPETSSEVGRLYVFADAIFDKDGQGYLVASISLDVRDSTFANPEKEPVQVRIDLDGQSYDMPSAQVNHAVFTFLDFRFPFDLLNKIAAAKTLKVYTIDKQTKSAKLFATADVSNGAAAHAELGKCAGELPDLPAKLPYDWQLFRDSDGTCLVLSGEGGYGMALGGPSNPGKATLAFQDGGEALKKPKVTIAGVTIPAEFRAGSFEGVDHYHLVIPQKDLDRLRPGAKLEISEDGVAVIGGEDLFPEIALTYLKRCASLGKRAS